MVELHGKAPYKTVLINGGPGAVGSLKTCSEELSRLKEKGIVDAIETVHNDNEENQYKFHLNIWGPIEEEFRDEFEEMIEKYPQDFSYKGTVNYNMSVETLTDHIALLFPTYWKGEGFPGTIIDAYAAGLPVIATDWNANSELIGNFKTGWV